jgi:uncharacterized protein (TIGR01244 family)
MEPVVAPEPPPVPPGARRLSNLRLFLLVSVTTFLAVSLYFFLTRLKPSDRPPLTQVSGDVFITSQLTPKSLRYLRSRGIRTLVDVRPDGEAPDQPPSSAIAEAARPYQVAFHYLPVPHESIPDSAIDSLAQVLAKDNPSTLLYCRTGRRAVRLLALAEATRPDGPNLNEILKLVRDAGFEADDLRERLQQRIAARAKAASPKP